MELRSPPPLSPAQRFGAAAFTLFALPVLAWVACFGYWLPVCGKAGWGYALIMLVGVLCRVQVGHWARQQRKTISRLQVRLAELDAEREMRRIERPTGLVGTIREVAAILSE